MVQSGLFAAERNPPYGLEFHPGFISIDEEHELVARLEMLDFRSSRYRQYTARRQVVRFGAEEWVAETAHDAEEQDFPRIAFPDFLLDLRRRVATMLHIAETKLVHGLVTRYPVGAPIGWHRDAPHFEKVAGISLASEVRMRFKPMDGASRRPFHLALPRRSLYLMQDEIRWRWLHSLPPVPALRYSITFRTLVEA